MTRTALQRALDQAPVGPDGNRVRIALAFSGKRQKALAEAIGLSRGTVSAIVSGQHPPTLVTAQAIAEFFGVSIDTLFPRKAA